MNKLTLLIFLTGFFSSLANAEIYKRVDAEGRVTYSNVQTDNAVRVQVGHVRKAPAKPAQAAVVPNKKTVAKKAKPSKKQYTAKVSKHTQSRRDATRKQILLDEYASEKAALRQAEQAYQTGKAKPEIYRRKNADGSYSSFRNVPKYQAKLKSLKADVDAHRRNLDLLSKELASL